MATHNGVETSRVRLCDFVRRHREEIIADWEQRARALPAARDLSPSRLRDHLPELLERIAAYAEMVHGHPEVRLEPLPGIHALDRLDVGFDLKQVATEYAMLRKSIISLYRRQRRDPALDEVEKLDESIDVAITEAVEQYAGARERTLVAVDRLAAAAMESVEPAAFLSRLLEVLLETTAAVDSVVILLREGEQLWVRAAAGVEKGAIDSPRKIGEGFAGRIAAEKRPLEVRYAAMDELVQSPFATAAGVRAMYGVPLMEGDSVIGVAKMGSRTAYEFSAEDKLLFRTMVQRANALIVQAALMQREREARAQAERTNERLRFLENASKLLASTLDVQSTLDTVARLAVPAIADWCAVDVLEEDGTVSRVGLAHSDPAKMELARDLRRRFPDDPARATPARRVMQTGDPLVLPEIPDELLTSVAQSPEHLSILRKLGVTSALIVPLQARGKTVGTVSLVHADSGRRFSHADLPFAQDVAAHAALAIENARLYTQVQRTAALLDTVLAASPVGIAFLDRELRYVRVNEALAAMNGKPVEAHLGRTVREVLPRAADMLEPILRKVIDTGKAVLDLEFSASPPSTPHEIRHWLAYYYPVRSAEQVIGVGGLVFEITERKRAEKAVKDSEARLQAILEHAPVAIYVKDAEGRYLIANRQVDEVMRVPREQLIGRSDRELLPAAEAERLRATDSRVWAEGKAVAAEETMEVADGPRTYWSVKFPLPDADGTPVALCGISMDISERKRMEEELRRAGRFREEFIGILGHDLRNPVAAIKMGTHQLFTRGDLRAPQAKVVARIARSADRMERLIRDILDFTRGRMGGGIPVQPTSIDMAEVVRHAVEELQAAHPDRVIQFEATGDCTGTWDSARLSQVVGNLVGNAVEHGEPHSPVKVSVRSADDEVVLCVWNSGRPIPSELKPTLFEPFERRGRTKGLGLGLYIVAQIVRAHGGSVSVESSAEAGTSFCVTWPRLPPPDDHQ